MELTVFLARLVPSESPVGAPPLVGHRHVQPCPAFYMCAGDPLGASCLHIRCPYSLNHLLDPGALFISESKKLENSFLPKPVGRRLLPAFRLSIRLCCHVTSVVLAFRPSRNP